MDADMLQGIGAIGALIVTQTILFGGLLRWQLSILERRMDRNHRRCSPFSKGTTIQTVGHPRSADCRGVRAIKLTSPGTMPQNSARPSYTRSG